MSGTLTEGEGRIALMGRACLTVLEYPSMKIKSKRKGGGVDSEKIECNVVIRRLW